MSLTKSTTARRRLALFTGSSMAAAGLAAVVSAGAVLAPAAARAANECGVQSGSTPLVCSATTYNGGVTYDANGNLVITFTPTTANIGTVGINLTGQGSESITVDAATTNTELQSTATSGSLLVGPLLYVQTVNGAIDIDVEEVDADQSPAGVTHAIFAEATGTGSISIRHTNTVDAQGSNPAGSIGIEAESTSGAIILDSDGVLAGNLYGALLTTTTGAITVNKTDGGAVGSAGGFVATSGSGDILFNMHGGQGNIRATTGGNVTVDLANNGQSATVVTDTSSGAGATTIGISSGRLDTLLDATVGSGGLTLNVVRDSTTLVTDFRGSMVIRGPAAQPVVLNVSGLAPAEGTEAIFVHPSSGIGQGGNPQFSMHVSAIKGVMNLSDLDSGAAMNVGAYGAWVINTSAAQNSQLSPGDDQVHIQPDGYLSQEAWLGSTSLSNHVVDFGAGDDRLLNEGRLVVGPAGAGVSVVSAGVVDLFNAELLIEGVETFDNAGDIYLGALVGADSNAFASNTFSGVSDQYTDDILAMPGTLFHGAVDEGGAALGRLFLDVDLNQFDVQAPGTTRCNASGRNAQGDLPAADCLNLEGGGATGRTLVVVRDRFPGDRGAYNPTGVMIVDLTGANPEDVDPHAFSVAPGSDNFDAQQGGIVDKGLFAYIIGYDADAQQFGLYGIEGTGSQQFPLIAQAVNDVWRTSTAGLLERRAEQRAGGADAEEGSAWMRVTMRSADRDSIHALTLGTTDFAFDNTHTQDQTVVNLGRDWLIDAGAVSWAVGGAVGYARNEIGYETYANTANIEGVTGGLYGGFTSGGLFVDAAVNGFLGEMTNDVPIMNLEPEGTILGSDVTAYGAQLEAGWRLLVGPASVEPLASVVWSSTAFKELIVPSADTTRLGGEVTFEDARSLRAGVGVRLGMDDLAPQLLPISLRLTAKRMEEMDGEAAVSIVNVGPTALVSNTFDGAFNEVNAAVSFGGGSMPLSGFLSIGGVWGDDYEAQTGSVGVRLVW